MTKSAFGFGSFVVVFSDRPVWCQAITKTLLVMKLTILLLTAAFLNVQGKTTAQSVTISGKDIPLQHVFSTIEQQTGYVVFYNKQLLSSTKTVTLTVDDMPLRDFLEVVLENQPISYLIKHKNIFLSKKSPAVTSKLPGIPSTYTRIVNVINVKGKVFDEAGKLLGGVSVVVKNSNKGTFTGPDGSFSIDADKEDWLVFSFVGYEKKEVKVSQQLIVVQLNVSHAILDETQITAYGKTTKRLATGNIVSITADDIARQPVMSVQDALIGRVPGMVVNKVSGNSAAPINLTIRGKNTINSAFNTDPLYVIDGVPLTFLPTFLAAELTSTSKGAVQAGVSNTGGENPLFHLNPNDIERIDVLKDADATSIYGSRGANGVILITTKKAKPGSSSLSFKLDYAPTFNQRYPKLLNTEEYFAVRREAFRNDGLVPDRFNAPDLTIWDANKYTDWQRKLIGVGNMTSANLSSSGGSQQTAYRLSAGYQSSKEIMNNGGKNIRMNLGTSFMHASKDNRLHLSSIGGISLTQVTAYQMGTLAALPPNAPDIYTENGNFNFEPYRGQLKSNFPFAGLGSPSTSKTVSANGSLNISYEWLNGLRVSTLGGYNLSMNNIDRLLPSTTLDNFYPQPYRNTAYYGKTTTKSYNIDQQIAYTKMISKGKLALQLVGNYQFVSSSGLNIEAQNFSNDGLMKSFNNASIVRFSEAYKEYAYLSGAAIVNYVWDSKYILNVNLKRDGSSRFAPGKQFGNFYSTGLAWILSEEKWLQRSIPDWVSFIKLRGSTGITGSDNIGDYKYLSQWSNNQQIVGAAKMFPYNGVDGYHVVDALNQTFHWEALSKSEVGVSLSFLNNALSLEVNTYRNVSSNQLLEMPAPSYTGFTSLTTNWEAKVANKGIEAMVAARLIQSKDINLNLGFAISRNKDWLLDFPNIEKSRFNGRLRVGESMNTQYLLHYLGIDPLTGNFTFEDYNKDGLLTSPANITAFPTLPTDDRYIAVQTNEKYFGNLNINFSYKRISINTNIYFVNKLVKDPYLSANIGEMANIHLPKEIVDNHWKQPGDIAQYPKFTTIPNALRANILGSDAMYVDGSYVRIQGLSIRYELPERMLKRMGGSNASLSLNTSNLYTLTRFKGLDVDVPVSTSSTPIPRMISTSFLLIF